jgi:hypothetical protein
VSYGLRDVFYLVYHYAGLSLSRKNFIQKQSVRLEEDADVKKLLKSRPLNGIN